MSTANVTSGTFAPDPSRSSTRQVLAAQVGFELRLLVRNGEQLLLALVIPIAALIGMTLVRVVPLPEPRVDQVVPGVWTLAILSSAFTSLAISTAFERRYAVLKRLLGAGVGRRALLAGKAVATAVVASCQLLVLGAIGVGLGWRPDGNPGWWLLVVAWGVAALSGLGLLLGGLFRAELVLGLANLVWLVLVAIGGVLVPLAGGGWVATVGSLTPVGALSTALHTVLAGEPPPVGPLAVLAGWAVAAWLATLQWFRWQ